MKPPPWTLRTAEIAPAPRRDDVIVETMDGETLLSDPRSDSAFHLNETARAVWDACDGRTTMRRIAAQLAERYEVSVEDALDDVEQLVVLFAESGLLQRKASA